MKRTKEKYIKAFGKDCNALNVEVAYEEGGTSWYSGQFNRRGIYVRVSPCEVESTNYGRSVKYQLGRGAKVLVKELGRFSQKQLDSISLEGEHINNVIDIVCLQNGIAIVKDENDNFVTL
jgi:hypothetical protein